MGGAADTDVIRGFILEGWCPERHVLLLLLDWCMGWMKPTLAKTIRRAVQAGRGATRVRVAA